MHLSAENVTYSNHHRVFLQKMMDKNVLTKDQALQMYIQTNYASNNEATEVPDEKIVQHFIDEINTKIEPLNMRIKFVLCETQKKKVYVLHVINENAITKAIAERCTTKTEREFLLAAVKAIVTSPSGAISEMIVINLTSELSEHVSKKEATKMLSKLFNQNWLQMVHGHVSLSPRLMVEMKKYLQEEYANYITSCQLCKDLTLVGEKCPAGCRVKLHKPCMEAYFGKVASRKCPGCKKPWPVRPQSPDPASDDEDVEY